MVAFNMATFAATEKILPVTESHILTELKKYSPVFKEAHVDTHV